MEFCDVDFSYIDNDTHEEIFVAVPEQSWLQDLSMNDLKEEEMPDNAHRNCDLTLAFIKRQPLPSNGDKPCNT